MAETPTGTARRSTMGQFAVIGLGRFGSATSLELMRLGHSVLGVDADGRVVDQMADRLTRAAIADVTDRDTLAELGLGEYDVVLVAIGEDLQASLVCTVHLKSLGVKELWVKASSRAHQDRKSTRLNSSHVKISYAVFCLKKKKKILKTKIYKR